MIASLLVGLVQGLLHGMGPDHCAAVATLGTHSGGGRRGAVCTAVRFALGHTVVLGALALGCLLLGVGISEALETWAEMVGGAVLLGLALAALFFPGALRHGHAHLPGHDRTHTHPPHGGGLTLSTAAGALMAVSGARALLLALPPLVVGGTFSLGAWAYLPGFAAGILVSMGAVGLVVAEGASRAGHRLRRLLERSVAVGSAAVGVWWIVARL
jgi:nickel/cobalt exporter